MCRRFSRKNHAANRFDRAGLGENRCSSRSLLAALALAPAHVLLLLPYAEARLSAARLPALRGAATSGADAAVATADLAAGWLALGAVVLLVIAVAFKARRAPVSAALVAASRISLAASTVLFLLPLYVATAIGSAFCMWLSATIYVAAPSAVGGGGDDGAYSLGGALWLALLLAPCWLGCVLRAWQYTTVAGVVCCWYSDGRLAAAGGRRRRQWPLWRSGWLALFAAQGLERCAQQHTHPHPARPLPRTRSPPRTHHRSAHAPAATRRHPPPPAAARTHRPPVLRTLRRPSCASPVSAGPRPCPQVRGARRGSRCRRPSSARTSHRTARPTAPTAAGGAARWPPTTSTTSGRHCALATAALPNALSTPRLASAHRPPCDCYLATMRLLFGDYVSGVLRPAGCRLQNVEG